MRIPDPLYGEIGLDEPLARLLRWEGIQRLRYIRLEGVADLTHPSMNHSRLSHAVGAAFLAQHIYDAGMAHCPRQLALLPAGGEEVAYWRRVLGVAALLRHALALPFSAEAFGLFWPTGQADADTLSNLLASEDVRLRLDALRPPLSWQDVRGVATGLSECPWQRFLHQTLVAEPLGAEGLDRALRNSHHMGVQQQSIDWESLVQAMRYTYAPDGEGLVLALDVSALRKMENQALGRFLYAKQVLADPLYSLNSWHLQSFLSPWMRKRFKPYYRKAWSPWRRQDFPGNEVLERYVDSTDDALRAAWIDAARKGDGHALGLKGESPFRYLGELPAILREQHPKNGRRVYRELLSHFGPRQVLHMQGAIDRLPDFALAVSPTESDWAFQHSEVFKAFPSYSFDYFFVSHAHYEGAQRWFHEEVTEASVFRPALKRLLKRVFRR